jgi:hypothetical protein
MSSVDSILAEAKRNGLTDEQTADLVKSRMRMVGYDIAALDTKISECRRKQDALLNEFSELLDEILLLKGEGQ